METDLVDAGSVEGMGAAQPADTRLTEGLKCALEKGWVMKDADSESWLLTELGYKYAIGSYFYRHGMSVTS
jgi:hypothetical protein